MQAEAYLLEPQWTFRGQVYIGILARQRSHFQLGLALSNTAGSITRVFI